LKLKEVWFQENSYLPEILNCISVRCVHCGIVLGPAQRYLGWLGIFIG